jgi:tRNA-2-methylthio-N6-dimethylallyladenosine synthase
MDGQLDDSIKEERNQRLLAVVDRLAIASNAAVVGTRQTVLCEGTSKNNATRLTGRTPQNKIVIFDGDSARLTGRILDIQIEQSTGFTLFGTAALK